jgi:hypothetical protein
MPRSLEGSVQPGKVLSQIAAWTVAVSAWILAWLGVVCLLFSLRQETRAHPHHELANRSSEKSRELVSFSSYRILPSTSTKFIHSRASPRACFFPPVLFLSADDAGLVGPPWLDYRAPPGSIWAPGQDVTLLVTPAALSKGQTRTFFPKFRKFLTPTVANLKTRGFVTGSS